MTRPPIQLLHRIFITHKYLHFFATGIAGVLLNLLITWALTTFIYGINGYFIAYLIGTGVNLLFNFIIHTLVTFRTRTRHFSRLLGFIFYNIGMTAVQASIIKYMTELIGLHYYLIVIAATILLFSMGNFIVFKFFLFHEHART